MNNFTNFSSVRRDNSLLLVDDDEPFLKRLSKAMEKRGFEVKTSLTVLEGKKIIQDQPPAHAVVDLRLQDGNGLDIVELIQKKREDATKPI